MHMNHSAFAPAHALRVSLKRGLARQAITMARRAAPHLPGLFRCAADLRPNRKSVERIAARLKSRPGVIRAARTGDCKGLTFIVREVRSVEARVEDQIVFEETGLIYLRAGVRLAGSRLGVHLSAVSFCLHALERLVERSDVPLQSALLPQVDAEALAIFRAWARGGVLTDTGDEYYPAAAPGVWAGGHDELSMDPDWGLSNPKGHLPIFSARTFLSEAEMRPTVWLRWKDDPSCRVL